VPLVVLLVLELVGVIDIFKKIPEGRRKGSIVLGWSPAC
jgi:hypothetical protein